MSSPSQSAPPEAFVEAWRRIHYIGIPSCAHDSHLVKVETEAAWWDGSLGAMWRAAQAAAYEEAARIAEAHDCMDGCIVTVEGADGGPMQASACCENVAAAIRERAGRRQ